MTSPGRVAGYGLSRHAIAQMDERGIDREQVATALLNPSECAPDTPHGTRAQYANRNVSVFVNDRTRTILAVLRQGEVDELAVKPPPATKSIPAQYVPREKRRRPRPAPVKRSHVLDAIHPALRAEITRLVDGDFTRIVVHSPMKVEIRPL